jgi:peroxiredoxin
VAPEAQAAGRVSTPAGRPGSGRSGHAGEPTGTPGEPTDLPGEPTDLPGEPTGLPGEPTGLPGEPTGLPGEAPASGAPAHRLDPDRAAALAGANAVPAPGPPPPVIDTRRYRWMIGICGLVLVVVISIYQFATHGIGTTGVPAGQRLHEFAAPLAASNLNGDPNLNPPCTLARHDPRALNICLLARRRPLVLAFFVTGSRACERQVDALQALSAEFPASTVQFAAVAVNASHSSADALVRSHHWTIPVAYDRDGAVGALYGVVVCPMVELANRGGVVRDRLIGDRWQTVAALAPDVRALIAASAQDRRGQLGGGPAT